MTETGPQMPFLADAATVELEDLGPLEEATGEPMRAAPELAHISGSAAGTTR